MPFASVDTSGFDQLAQALDRARGEVEDALEEGIGQAGELIAEKARLNAHWSSTIPPTIKEKPNAARVVISAGSPEVLIAKWYEQGRTDNGPWRHPVWPVAGSDRASWVWVDQTRPSRPFLRPALIDNTEEAMQLVADVVLRRLDVELSN